ncbi:H-2 class II histocompatibility antigen, E-S beta chain-like [Tiliqua scincoides]|uniref:H-2 class II histocompatibility antigen, E-S beta chain-like n=1 Tax=Tiliqua scincoides TaxID=71010 RepID=UPI003461D5DF
MGPALGIGVLLVVMVVGALPPEVQSRRPPEHFVFQGKAECRFPDGPGPGAYYLERYFYFQQEYARFDSRRGTFEAVTELGEPDARYWNSRPEVLEDERAALDRFCRHNYGVVEPFAAARKLKPQLKITPTDTDPPSHHTLLVCTVAGFFPAKINITWLRNGQEEDESRVVSTELIRNGDWTFRIQVMLEAQPEHGDIYTCLVEHTSLPAPTSVQWEPQSDSARSKMWTGVVGLLLGLVFVVPGLVLYLMKKKGTAIPPPAALIS